MFGASDACAPDDAEVFNIERVAIRERVGRMRTLLPSRQQDIIFDMHLSAQVSLHG